jgi:hypothetical protein
MTTIASVAANLAFGAANAARYFLHLTTDDLSELDDTAEIGDVNADPDFDGYAPISLTQEDLLAHPLTNKGVEYTWEVASFALEAPPEPTPPDTHEILGWYLVDNAGALLAYESIDQQDVTNAGDKVTLHIDFKTVVDAYVHELEIPDPE